MTTTVPLPTIVPSFIGDEDAPGDETSIVDAEDETAKTATMSRRASSLLLDQQRNEELIECSKIASKVTNTIYSFLFFALIFSLGFFFVSNFVSYWIK